MVRWISWASANVQLSMDFDSVFTRETALASGISDGQLRRGRQRGELIAIRPGVYVTTEHFCTLDSEQQHLLLATSAPDRPILSHVSAAIAWGFDVWALPLARVHVTAGVAIRAKTTRRRVTHGSALEASEHTVHNGISLTTPARTVVDIARSTDFERAVCAGDSALRRGLVTFSELQQALVLAKHRSGVSNAAAAIAAMTDRSESVGETRSRLILVAAGFAPRLNQSIFDADGRFLGRVDFVVGGPPSINEFDGAGKYGQSAETVRRAVLDEKTREDRIRDVGWVLTRWGWNDLATPQDIIARVHRSIARASRLPPPEGTIRSDPLPPFVRPRSTPSLCTPNPYRKAE